MDYPKEIFVKDYFEIHEYYSKLYGKSRTIILMQVGSFHEAYATDTDGLDLVSLAQDLDVHCTRKNGNIPLSKSNPRMMGFPIHVTTNFVDKLIDMNYTVVLIDQVTEPPNPKRMVTGIYSPATHIEKKNIGNASTFLVSIVIDKIRETNQLCVGLAAYDLATGEGSVYETYSQQSDVFLGLDDANIFLENHPPREIVLDCCDDMIANFKMDDILGYLNIEPGNTYHITKPYHNKISYQKKLLEETYNLNVNVDVIDMLGLQFLNWGRKSLVLLIDYVKGHQMKLLEKLHLPTIFSSNKYLYLGNRALEQLDGTSLFNIINHTKTSIGKRYLMSQLSLPLIDTNILNKRYDMINSIMSGNHMNRIVSYLEDVYDMDKLIRKLEINIINPNELYQIYLSIYQINKLTEYFVENKLDGIFDINKNMIKNTKKIIQYIESTFICGTINGLSFVNFTETDKSFYNKEIHKELDTLQESIDTAQNFMTYLVKTLSEYIDDKIYFKKNKDDDSSLITLKYNDRDGHYLMITNRRCEILKKNISKVTKIKVGAIDVETKDLEFVELPKSSNTKINCNKIKEISLDLVNYKIAMSKKLKEIFKKDMMTFLDNYGEILHVWSHKIAHIDFINSGAIGATTNHYTKPIINSKPASYFKGKEMRHPIIEKISTDTVYVPHDLELGYETEQNGILLYGINSSGKSTLMKSIGLNIVMAQMGYYVAATKFEYSPYVSLFTRICGNDNMFKGLSSFMVEMMELMAILKRNNNKTLVLGDELAKGTEFRSGIVIVSYMLEKLAASNSSFITATHLHDINKLESIKKLKNVKTKHLKITYDSMNDMLIYDRHLLDGQGETFYGLQVAKFLMKDKTFNERTLELLNEYDNIQEVKTSKYNSKLYVDKCEICKATNKLETHHIVWQKDFTDDVNNSKYYLQKNDTSNLVILCMECHDKVDRGTIHINGWVETSNGRKFDYTVEATKKALKSNSKYSDEVIQYIRSIQVQDVKMARIKIKEKFDKKISSKTITNIWENI